MIQHAAFGLLVLLSAGAALGQNQTYQAKPPEQKPAEIKPSPIDLDKAAKSTREGQAVPKTGDAAEPDAAKTEAVDATGKKIKPAPQAVLDAAREPAPGRPVPAAMALPPDPVGGRFREMGRPAATIKVIEAGSPSEVRRFEFSGVISFDRWRAARLDDSIRGGVEVRTAGGDDVALRVDERATVKVRRLTKARIGLMTVNPGEAAEAGKESTATRVVVELYRGRVRVEPAEGMTAMVATPDSIVVVRGATEVWYDAVLGTRSDAK